MILPIYVSGSNVLRAVAKEVPLDYPALGSLVDNMFETMRHAEGVGLAAPQVGLSLRLFVVDASPFAEDNPELAGFTRVLINPKIVRLGEREVPFNEGCLSIPGVHEDVMRPDEVEVEYQDVSFGFHRETYTGIVARIVQHEYDHLEGKLFTDRISSLRRRLLQGKLKAMARGRFSADYRCKVD